MNISSIIFCGLILIQIITANMIFTDYVNDYMNKFEEKRLKIVVNYATDAAVQEMKNQSANLGQDYENLSKLNVDPIVAMDTFSTILCKNYGVPLNSTNQQNIMTEYCPVFLVATYDGCYVANKEKINSSGVVNYIFSNKVPYIGVNTDTNGNELIYSYNMSLDYAIKVDNNGNIYKTYDLPINKSKQLNIINSKISDILNENLVKYASTEPKGKIYVPFDTKLIKSTNAVKNTSVIAYIDNFDLCGYGYDLQSFGIGGSEIKQKKVVVGFEIEIDGKFKKYYTYSDTVPDKCNVIEVFNSPEDAAGNGYYFYVK